ncbi:MAG: acyl-CoA dehydratase activase-related protein [Dehalococcoidales bacterium]|jgi:predicted nucleotide-binding protein (sugar kinase/HSP70/actin superfamily)|nr:acyl-CoA dehydratase activase-related protein [Dehalococcoidales bacterium]
MTRIGIPRALLYYQYLPMWKAFFEHLGAEVVISSPTTQAMLTGGSARVVADTCLPVKVFLGHVLSLADECDLIFVPAVRSLEEKVYNCSKFLGLPDMTKAVIPESPPILETDIDINRGKNQLYREIYRLGRYFTRNPLKVKQAGLTAWQAHLDYRELMFDHKLTHIEATEKICGIPAEKPRTAVEDPASTRTTIALLGHPYLICDEFINHRLIYRLEQAGNRVLTPEMITTKELESAIIRLTGGSYWTYEEEVVGAGGYFLQNEADGVIGIMAFGCGPDSLMMDTVRRHSARTKGVPFMCLTIEEHTAEAGVITRLEAFTDMIQRKKRRET